MDLKRKTIILAPGINAQELYKSLAIHGVNTIDVSIFNGATLAKEMLIHSGVFSSEKLLSRKDQELIVSNLIKDISYFDKASLSDISYLVSVINTIRNLVVGSDEKVEIETAINKGKFVSKNAAVFELYSGYMKHLSDNNAVDRASLMKEAINKASSFTADFICLKEFPLTALEKELLSKASNNSYKEITLAELFGKSIVSVKLNSIKNCYGASNEIEQVIEDIFQENVDNAVIALADTSTYTQLLFDYSRLHNIPIVFGSGLPVVNSTAGQLLSNYYRWCTSGYFGVEALNNLINGSGINSEFRELIKAKILEVEPDIDATKISRRIKTAINLAGKLKLTNNKTLNDKRLNDYEVASPLLSDDRHDISKYLPYLKVVSDELSLSVLDFVYKYTYMRELDYIRDMDLAGREYVCSELNGILSMATNDAEKHTLIANLLLSNIPGHLSKPGAIYVTDINGAFSTFRSSLYIVGLSANSFPGKARENYILLDSDFGEFGESGKAQMSTYKIRAKSELLIKLVETASALGIKVNVSYAGLNVSELKNANVSSAVYSLCELEKPGITYEEIKNKIEKVSYFGPKISSNRLIGEAYVGRKKIKANKPKASNEKPVKWALTRAYSPSELGVFFDCNRKFYYSSILGIKDSDRNDLFSVIPANDEGTLAHSLMELYATSNYQMTSKEFISKAEEFFNAYIDVNQVLDGADIEGAKKQFVDLLQNAYNTDPKNEVVIKEEDISCTHSSGVKLHGYPDRVEKLPSNKLQVVDFKFGKKLKHRKDDPISCIQAIIYAYILEKNGYKDVERVEFRYLRYGVVITCKYDDESKNILNELLENFKTTLSNGVFNRSVSDENCKFCPYKDLCGRDE